MTRRAVIVVIVIGLGVIGGFLYLGKLRQYTFRKTAGNDALAVPQPATAPPAPQSSSDRITTAPETQARQAYMAAFMKPISFVGKVIDEKGNAVSGATIEWRANNNPHSAGVGTNGTASSDERGMFAIRSRGIALFVKVSKVGYYSLNEAGGTNRRSSGEFSNATVLGNTESPMGTDRVPAVFTLLKHGPGVALLHVSERPIKIPKDGTPVELALDTGRTVSSGYGHLRIECWTNDQSKDAHGSYPWRCQVSVPGGGLVYRENQFDFQAPVDGYQASDEIQPPKLKWSAVGERQYFIKTGDGHFARLSLRMRATGEHFAVIESYFNPVPNSRNLEANGAD